MSKPSIPKKDAPASKETGLPSSESVTTINHLEQFKLLGKLGDGAYSQVYKVKRFEDGEVYALKKVKLHHLSDKEKENAINEVRILASIKHRNVISYKEAFMEPNTQSLCIVMEHADNGDLFQKICDFQKDNSSYTEAEIWKIFIQIVKGLKAMHDLNIMHRDLKSANVFLNKDSTVKLGDMNVSKVANQRGLNYTQTGTPYYASPEVWRDEPYDIKSDIWSLGCVLYEITMLKPPFQSSDMQGLYKRVIKGQFPKISKAFSNDLWNMIKLLLQVNPNTRPDCKQIMSMAAFKSRAEDLFKEEGETDMSELLKTIRIPKNLMYISDRLPSSNYLKGNNVGSSFKMNKSANQRQTRILYQSQQSSQDVKLPNLQNHNKSLIIKKASDQLILNKNQSQMKIVPKNEQTISDDNNYVKNEQLARSEPASQLKKIQPLSQYESHPKQNSSDKRKQSEQEGTVEHEITESPSHSTKKQLLRNDSSSKEITAKVVEDTYELKVPSIDATKSSVYLNSSLIVDKTQHKRDFSNPVYLGMSRDHSLKKLHRDQSQDCGILASSNRSGNVVEQSAAMSKQRLNDIYNLRQSKKMLLLQSNDGKKLKQPYPQMPKKYLVINSSKVNIGDNLVNESVTIDYEPRKPLIINQQQQLAEKYQVVKPRDNYHHGMKHAPKKSQQYLYSLNKIASVYQKTSLSPIQRYKSRDRSQGPYEQPSAISISSSNVKLPQVNHKSSLSQISQSMEVDTTAERYQPYEHATHNALTIGKKLAQKNKMSISKNLTKEYQKDQYASSNSKPKLNQQYLIGSTKLLDTNINKSMNFAEVESSSLLVNAASDC